jgi:hypothetical protein
MRGEATPGGPGTHSEYELKGFIGYNGGHYVAWFRTTESDQAYDLSIVQE